MLPVNASPQQDFCKKNRRYAYRTYLPHLFFPISCFHLSAMTSAMPGMMSGMMSSTACPFAASRFYRLAMFMAMIADSIRITVRKVVTDAIAICIRIAVVITNAVLVFIYKAMVATHPITISIHKAFSNITVPDAASRLRFCCCC